MDFDQIFGEKAEDLKGYPVKLGDGTLYIAPMGNSVYLAEVERLRQELEDNTLSIFAGTRKLSDEENLNIVIGAMAKGILVNWDNMQDQGEVIRYSVANAKIMLRKYERLRNGVMQAASELQQQRLQTLEDEEKNSLTLLTGNSKEVGKKPVSSKISAESVESL